MSDRRVGAFASGLSRWGDEFDALRAILLDAELTEAFKWGKPCYTHGGGNVVIFQPFKECCALMFFRGALLQDPAGLLRTQGEASRTSRRLEFRSPGDVTDARDAIRAFVTDAIRVQREGLRVPAAGPPSPREYPDELVALLQADPKFAAAFERLTPGRRRGYVLHFNQAKRSSTRLARIERVRQRILEGLGLHD